MLLQSSNSVPKKMCPLCTQLCKSILKLFKRPNAYFYCSGIKSLLVSPPNAGKCRAVTLACYLLIWFRRWILRNCAFIRRCKVEFEHTMKYPGRAEKNWYKTNFVGKRSSFCKVWKCICRFKLLGFDNCDARVAAPPLQWVFRCLHSEPSPESDWNQVVWFEYIVATPVPKYSWVSMTLSAFGSGSL